MSPLPLPAGRRVAIVHEWLTGHAGSERVVDELLTIFPEADLFALVCAMPGEAPGRYRGRPVRTSFLQRLTGGRQGFRALLPIFPEAVESFDLRGYDLVISSSHCVAKGARTRRPDQLHLTYCHTPVRYAWDLQETYLAGSGFGAVKRAAARVGLARLRRWDRTTSDRTDLFITNSHFVADRVARYYGRSSVVVPPPVDTETFRPVHGERRGFISVSRFVPYKQIPLIVEAFRRMPDQALTVVGDGPDRARCQAAAQGASNIRFIGHAAEGALPRLLSGAQAFLFAALEDFGIAPLEAQACGTPVIAYGAGGALETVIDGETGLFFDAQTPDAIIAAVRRFLASPPPSEAACRQHAERFAIPVFRARITEVIARAWDERPTPESTRHEGIT